MNSVKNILSIIGGMAVVALFVVMYKVEPAFHAFMKFDEKAMDTYTELMQNIIATGNAAEATVWKIRVDEGLDTADVEEAMRSVANEHNIKNVGELPLSKQIELMSGKPYRYMKIFMFCNALTAANMVDYSDAFSAYLPCRVTLLEDKKGRLWIYSLNMDLMIHGGNPLPPLLKEEAIKVKLIIKDIMQRGAKGEF